MPRLHSLLSVLTVIASLPAQGLVGPTLLSPPRTSTAFDAARLGVGSVQQICMIPDPWGEPGRFIGGLTVSGLSPALGGVGGYDLVSFTYDRATDSATLNANAAALNTLADEFALNYAASGDYVVFERIGLGLFQAPVALFDGAIGAPLPIQSGPLPGAIDPCPARIDGRPVLFYNDGTAIVRREHDVASATLVGNPVAVALPRTPGGSCHSAWPVAGIDGDAEALLVCESTAPGQSAWQWAGDLAPATVTLPQDPSTAWDFNGCLAGGRIYMCRWSGGVNTIREYDVSVTLGDEALCQGDYAEVTVLAPPRPNLPIPDLCFVFAGISYLPSPVSFPGLALGALGIANGFQVGMAEHDPVTGTAMVPLRVPRVVTGNLPIQAITLSPTSNTVTIASTAALRLLGGAGTRSATLLPGPLAQGDHEVLDGEPFERLLLPNTHGPIESVAFAPPNDPSNPWVPDRDFAAVILPDGSCFVDVRRAGAFVVEITTTTDLVKKFFVKSKKLKFTAGAVPAFKLAPPFPLPPQYRMPYVVRQRPDRGDNGYAVGLGLIFPQAPSFGSVGELARTIDAMYMAQPAPRQPIDLLICCHGVPAGFQINDQTYVAATGPATLNNEANSLLGGGFDALGAYPGIQTKVRNLVVFACMVACPNNNNIGPAFLQMFVDGLDGGRAGVTTMTAWDVCSYTVPPSRGWINGRVVTYPAWMGIGGGRIATTRNSQ